MSRGFDSIESVIEDLSRGQMVIVVDDADRENEGDLILAAEHVDSEKINFMVKKGGGLICVPTTAERLKQLGIGDMVNRNRDALRTAFQVSVDARKGITTGISAPDRARTIQVLADSVALPEDLVQPGHIFPLRANDGGVLTRAGHTEAAVDLVRLAGCRSVGVICEIMGDSGEMARLPELLKFADEHGLRICAIADLIKYRRTREILIERVEVVKMPTEFGEFDLYLYRSKTDGRNHLALVKGDLSSSEDTLVRVHSECLTGDVFGSKRCDCGAQLHQAMRMVAEAGKGVIVYMKQEGRGIGLESKIRAYKLQESGLDTVQANLKLGYPIDLREYGLGAQILTDLGLEKICLLTNNPKKIIGLDGYGLEVVKQIPIKVTPNEHNSSYLETKRDKMGHLL